MSRCIVVIPTYNEAENLPELVPRVLEQDARIEVLVVDDDSPDGTGKLAAELAGEDPRVHVLQRDSIRIPRHAYQTSSTTLVTTTTLPTRRMLNPAHQDTDLSSRITGVVSGGERNICR